MHTQWHGNQYYPAVPYRSVTQDSDHMYQLIARLDRKFDELIHLMKENNRLLQSIQSEQSKAIPGGNTVVVRM